MKTPEEYMAEASVVVLKPNDMIVIQYPGVISDIGVQQLSMWFHANGYANPLLILDRGRTITKHPKRS